jgi:hypothetical protein
MLFQSAVLLPDRWRFLRTPIEMRSTVSSSVKSRPSGAIIGNGTTSVEDPQPVSNGHRPASHGDHAPRSPLLAKLTGLNSIAMVTAVGVVVVGVMAMVGGSYAKQVVHDQLAPQKIFFPAAGSAALLPGVKQYAGQQLVDGAQAKAYANNFINVHLSKVAGGQTYAQVSTAALAAPTNTTLATEKATLFQGETLRGLLLGAWGWSLIATIASLAGLILILLGGVLFLLPVANWQVNVRGGRRMASSA